MREGFEVKNCLKKQKAEENIIYTKRNSKGLSLVVRGSKISTTVDASGENAEYRRGSTGEKKVNFSILDKARCLYREPPSYSCRSVRSRFEFSSDPSESTEA
jgi:hypothetical protein